MDSMSNFPPPDSFEEGLSELEMLIKQMEGRQLNLNDTLLAFQRGIGLLQYCRQALNAADEQVQVLIKEDLL